MKTKQLDSEEELVRHYTEREIRMVMDRQRELRWARYQEKFEANLPVVAIVFIAVAVVALAILVGVN